MTLTEEQFVVRFMGDTKDYEKAVERIKNSGKHITTMDKQGNIMQEKWTSNTKKHGQEIVTVTNQQRRFKAELLSVMFFGMQMERVFGAQVSRLWELVGGQTMVKGFWTEAMVTPMSNIRDILGTILEKIPDAFKEPLGYGAVGITGVGKSLAWIGNIWLGLRGIEDMFGIHIISATKKGSEAMDLFGTKGTTALSGLGLSLTAGAWILGITAALIGVDLFLKELEKLDIEAERVRKIYYQVQLLTPGEQLPQEERAKMGQVGRETIISPTDATFNPSSFRPGYGGLTGTDIQNMYNDINSRAALQLALLNANNNNVQYIAAEGGMTR